MVDIAFLINIQMYSVKGNYNLTIGSQKITTFADLL